MRKSLYAPYRDPSHPLLVVFAILGGCRCRCRDRFHRNVAAGRDSVGAYLTQVAPHIRQHRDDIDIDSVGHSSHLPFRIAFVHETAF